jgi:hypothetical protein
MWSHYAQQHRGICIGFSVQDEFICDPTTGKDSGLYQRVHYPVDDSIPVISGRDKVAVNQMMMAVCTKSRHWEYEKECRVIMHPAWPDIMKHTTTGDTIPFPSESLTHVYLGARISQEDQNTVIKCLLSRKHPVELLKARRHPDKYELIFDSLGIVGTSGKTRST